MAFTYEYPRPALTVDCVVFGFDPDESDELLRVLLIRRQKPPFEGQWAIPGGFVEVSDDGGQGESLDDAARRELHEETGVEVVYLEQLYTFGDPGRDPRGRVVSVAYFALVRRAEHPATAGSDATDAAWFTIEEALDETLAFDHRKMLKLAVQRLQTKVRYAPIGFNLLPTEFTLGDLRKLYEALLARTLDVSNFHKKVEKALVRTGILLKTGEMQTGQHRPAPLYRFDKRAYDRAVKRGFNFEI